MSEPSTAHRGPRWIPALWAGAASLLLIPLVGMRFTDDFDWTAFDFAFAAVVLGAVCLGLQLALGRTSNPACRLGAGAAIAAAFFLVWFTGAVGVIGSEREAANLLYAGVLAIAFIGALTARFRPAGMARAMAAAAAAQVLVLPVALAFTPAAVVFEPKVLALTAGFAALWLAAAWLFRKAARGA